MISSGTRAVSVVWRGDRTGAEWLQETCSNKLPSQFLSLCSGFKNPLLRYADYKLSGCIPQHNLISDLHILLSHCQDEPLKTVLLEISKQSGIFP